VADCYELSLSVILPQILISPSLFGRLDPELPLKSGSWIMRLPQEDLCRALGVLPHLKYESDGGPGRADLAAVLLAYERAQEDLTTLYSPARCWSGCWGRPMVTPKISASSCWLAAVTS
jgi:hypothetical protein